MTDQAAIDALVARAMPRERVILAALPDHTEPRLDHVERHDVMVIPKEDWIQILIWLAAWVPVSPVRPEEPPGPAWPQNPPPEIFDGLGGPTFGVQIPEPAMVVGYTKYGFVPETILLPHQLTVARAREIAARGDGECWALPVDSRRAVFIGDAKTLKVGAVLPTAHEAPVRDPAPPEFPSDAADRAFWERLDAFFADWSGTERQVLNEALVAAFRAERGMGTPHLSASLEDLLLDYGRAEWSCGNRHTRADHPDGHCPSITDALNAVRAALRGVRDPSPPEPSHRAIEAAAQTDIGQAIEREWRRARKDGMQGSQELFAFGVVRAMLVAAYAVDFGVRGAGVVPSCVRCTNLLHEAEPTEEAVEHYELTGHFAGCPQRPIPLDDLVRRIVERVAELPDRTSPDDQPEMMLVTGDELAAIIETVWEEAGVAWGVVSSAPSPTEEVTAQELAHRMIRDAKQLPREAQRILFENLQDLYIGDSGGVAPADRDEAIRATLERWGRPVHAEKHDATILIPWTEYNELLKAATRLAAPHGEDLPKP